MNNTFGRTEERCSRCGKYPGLVVQTCCEHEWKSNKERWTESVCWCLLRLTAEKDFGDWTPLMWWAAAYEGIGDGSETSERAFDSMGKWKWWSRLKPKSRKIAGISNRKEGRERKDPPRESSPKLHECENATCCSSNDLAESPAAVGEQRKTFGVTSPHDVRLSGKLNAGLTLPSLVWLHKGESHFHSPLLI